MCSLDIWNGSNKYQTSENLTNPGPRNALDCVLHERPMAGRWLELPTGCQCACQDKLQHELLPTYRVGINSIGPSGATTAGCSMTHDNSLSGPLSLGKAADICWSLAEHETQQHVHNARRPASHGETTRWGLRHSKLHAPKHSVRILLGRHNDCILCRALFLMVKVKT